MCPIDGAPDAPFGTGFLVSPDGHLVTCLHVIDQVADRCGEFIVEFRYSTIERRRYRTVARDDADDLGLAEPVDSLPGSVPHASFPDMPADVLRTRPEVLAYAIPGTPEVPLQATGTYWREVHREAESADRALDSDTLTLTGLDPGAYTVIAFHFPVRNTREIRDAARISSQDFYAATLIASAKVTVRADEEEIQLKLAF